MELETGGRQRETAFAGQQLRARGQSEEHEVHLSPTLCWEGSFSQSIRPVFNACTLSLIGLRHASLSRVHSTFFWSHGVPSSPASCPLLLNLLQTVTLPHSFGPLSGFACAWYFWEMLSELYPDPTWVPETQEASLEEAVSHWSALKQLGKMTGISQ